MKPLVALLLISGPALAQAPAGAHLAPAAHAQSVLEFQARLNKEFKDPKESPLSDAERKKLQSLPFYPISYAHYVEARFVPDSVSLPFAMQTSTERRPMYRKFGVLHFTLQGQALQLSIYQSQDLLKRPGLEDYLFLPFTDLSNGHGSYGGGRYIDLRLPPKGATTMQLDFNQAYNPSCAYSARYSCPVPPVENRLPVAIPAGVQHDH
ncbi:DUF1684 domain-containing protein [Hymenobacter saemangeumensis]|uniref:DUF1684 domain-containing protein n=1 Tax=Hymenobacter saemangeumensis TaxID=1084522 RepID=A0ABP8IE10_9BACT